MKSRALLMLASVFLLALVASPMWADPLNPMVKLTVMQPVELPGHVLTPGQYYVETLDMGDVALVRSADGREAFFELLGSASRNQPANGVVVDVSQQETGVPPRIEDYFFPGQTYGTAFLYPLHSSAKEGKPMLHQRS